MTNLDISPEQLQVALNILKRHVPGREVWAFGSRSRGRAHKYSDLDLAVIDDAPLSLKVLADIQDDFIDSDLPFQVDILDWASADDSFRARVAAHKIVLLDKGAL